jgi:hypothetical protein
MRTAGGTWVPVPPVMLCTAARLLVPVATLSTLVDAIRSLTGGQDRLVGQPPEP